MIVDTMVQGKLWPAGAPTPSDELRSYQVLIPTLQNGNLQILQHQHLLQNAEGFLQRKIHLVYTKVELRTDCEIWPSTLLDVSLVALMKKHPPPIEFRHRPFMMSSHGFSFFHFWLGLSQEPECFVLFTAAVLLVNHEF